MHDFVILIDANLGVVINTVLGSESSVRGGNFIPGVFAVGAFDSFLVTLTQEEYGITFFGAFEGKSDSFRAVVDQEKVLVAHFSSFFGTRGYLLHDGLAVLVSVVFLCYYHLVAILAGQFALYRPLGLIAPAS